MSQLEAVVAKVDELEDGQMQQVSVGETKVLLVRRNGKYHAVGAFCSHYGAPLAKGVLHGDRLVCPWHEACFNAVSGEQEAPPGLDSLARYQVRREGEEIIVSVPEETSGFQTPSMARHNPDADGRTFVIIGAGAAGANAVETLRKTGYEGRIVMISEEDKLPYDRTALSKKYLLGKKETEDLPLRSPQFYQDLDIEFWTKTVTGVDASQKTITFSDYESLSYDALLVATGGKANQILVEGKDLANNFTLRSLEDAQKIIAATEADKQAVVIGSSFIGMETAAGLVEKGVKVIVVSPDSVPFETILGQEIGQIFQKVHEKNGVNFCLGAKATEFEGQNSVEGVILDNGDRLAADLVVVGIGVKPATEFLTGVELYEQDGSVVVDEYLRATDGVYAAGDIARYPDWRIGKDTRVEHWRVAAAQGRIAAYNMTGQKVKYQDVPVFWTMQLNFQLRYIGQAQEWDEVIFDGDPDEGKFIAFYVKDGRVLAAASSQRDTETAAIYELMRTDKMPQAEELRQGSVDLIARLSS